MIDTLKSGWLTTGQKVKTFEQDFINFLGGGLHAVAVNSATAGLHLGLEAVGKVMETRLSPQLIHSLPLLR